MKILVREDSFRLPLFCAFSVFVLDQYPLIPNSLASAFLTLFQEHEFVFLSWKCLRKSQVPSVSPKTQSAENSLCFSEWTHCFPSCRSLCLLEARQRRRPSPLFVRELFVLQNF